MITFPVGEGTAPGYFALPKGGEGPGVLVLPAWHGSARLSSCTAIWRGPRACSRLDRERWEHAALLIFVCERRT